MKFVPNPRFASELAHSDELRQVLEHVTDAVRDAVEASLPPSRDPRGWIPDLSAPGWIEAGVLDVGGELHGRIVNHDHAAAIYEYGGARTPVYAPLRRGVTAVGLRLVDGGQ